MPLSVQAARRPYSHRVHSLRTKRKPGEATAGVLVVTHDEAPISPEEIARRAEATREALREWHLERTSAPPKRTRHARHTSVLMRLEYERAINNIRSIGNDPKYLHARNLCPDERMPGSA